jgi:predicted nucleic acid-binding Zn ribbon protein
MGNWQIRRIPPPTRLEFADCHLRFAIWNIPMPTYVYEILDKSGNPTGKTFELVQSIKADALTKHPETGQPVRRAIVAPNLGLNLSASKARMSNKNLEKLGFTKYERKGSGYMERVAGKEGPKSISSED